MRKHVHRSSPLTTTTTLPRVIDVLNGVSKLIVGHHVIGVVLVGAQAVLGAWQVPEEILAPGIVALGIVRLLLHLLRDGKDLRVGRVCYSNLIDHRYPDMVLRQ